MKISDILQDISHYVESPTLSFSVPIQMFEEVNGRHRYNALIRGKVERKSGVYFWVDNGTGEIVYIGMAGSIKTDGRLSDHSIKERLLASRGKDRITGKDIQTNDYIHSMMKLSGMQTMDINVMYAKEGEAPAYIEALAMNCFFKRHKRLPLMNKAF
jgi:hypothetical protein